METFNRNSEPANAMNGSLNWNETGFVFPSTMFYAPYDGPLILLSILIILINSLVIYLFCTRESLQTKTNSLLISLAVTDLLNGLFSVPATVLCNLILDRNLCYANTVFNRFVSISTMYHICVITLERYIYVLYPMKYIHIVTAPRLLNLILTVWLFSIFVATIQTAWTSPERFFILNPGNDTLSLKINLVYSSFCAVVCFFIPLIIMIVSYTRMMIVIHRQITGIHVQNCPRNASGSPNRSPMATEARSVLIFAAMLTIFTVAWTSWYITSLELYLRGSTSIRLPIQVDDFFEFLRFSVSFLNPILYTFLKKDFSRALTSMLKRNFLANDSDSSNLRPVKRRNNLQVSYKSTSNPRSSRTSTSFVEHGDVTNNNMSNVINGNAHGRENDKPETDEATEQQPVL